MEVGGSLEQLDQALFEGFVTRDPLGFSWSVRRTRWSSTAISAITSCASSPLLVEKYSHRDRGGRNISNDLVLAAARVSLWSSW
jgi:hypothetical protein